MRASKEAASIAKINVERIVKVLTQGATQSGSVITDRAFRDAVSRSQDLLEFLNAAHRKLPTEAAFQAQINRNREKAFRD